MLAVSPEVKLKEAAELLSMVEQLCLGFSEQSSHDSTPWNGIRLTVEQSRRRVEEVCRGMSQPKANALPTRSVTLASRIQKVPPAATAAHVREIPLEKVEEGVT